MRALVAFLVVGWIATASAVAPPLSNKEIALMLRSGYSSESVLREIAGRRVLDKFDPATKKSLLEFGASPALISALQTGAFAASASEAEQAKRKSAEVAVRQAAQIEQEQKHSALSQTSVKTIPARPPAGVPLIEALKEKLVRCRNGTISRADGAELENKKLIGLYYSAHWCAPCRQFTPELVDYYNRVAPQHPEFEIIFISSDRSRFGWETYLRESMMPWLAIDYDQLGALSGLKQLGGDSIPSLLVADPSGHILASSYEGDQYLGPHNALAALEKIFAQAH